MEAADPLLPVVPKIGGDAVSMESSCTSPRASSGGDEPRLVGAGLKNLGNTCFLNSVLQCLIHTVPLVQRILQIKHSCSRSGGDDDFCSICSLKELIYSCFFSQKFVVVPSKFAENLSNISPSFQLGEEEDAHEFLCSLLNSLDTCCRASDTKDKPSDDDSIVKQVFGGRLRSQLLCRDCGYCSNTFEALLDLSLEIDDVDTIEDALRSYTKLEPIEDMEIKFTCEGCKAQVSMEKQLKLDQLPEVVTLHLKRFKISGVYLHKIDKHVEYPLELDFRPFLSCSDDNMDFIYDLYAVVVHHGSTNWGHYFCSVRSSPNTWHQMNDSTVTKVSEADVLDQDAYLLFYIKRGSTCWLSNLMETIKIPQMCITPDTSPVSVLDLVQTDRSSSAGEASCSISPRTMPERSKTVDPSVISSVVSSSFATSLDDDARYHVATSTEPSSNLLNSTHEADTVSSDGFLTQSTLPSHDRDKPAVIQPPMSEPVMDMFTDELSGNENEEEQHTVEHKSKRAVDLVKDPREQGQVFKLLRGMIGSRRQGLLSCMESQKRPADGGRHTAQKQHKKQKVNVSDARPLNRNETPRTRPASQSNRVLSPRSIRRGLFVDDDQ